MVAFKGLDKFVGQKVCEKLDGEFGVISFDSTDPVSIESAIIESERLIDERLGAYKNNPMIDSALQEIKERFRATIVDKAAETRLKEKSVDEE